MDDPRKIPVPENATASEKAEILARDLAYGAEVGDWHLAFNVYNNNWYQHYYNDDEGSRINQNFEVYVEEKWSNNPPSIRNLIAYGFAIPDGNQHQLTDKAIDLLKVPSEEPHIFISYRRAESSAFALLIEARFRIVGNDSVFIDKNLLGGQPWHKRLESEIGGSKFFVCLIGPTTLESEFVRREIEWAIKNGCFVIPICHNGQTLDAATAKMPHLGSGHGHEIKGEAAKASAADYETAVNFILNSCGYPTY